jgi:hypothetical protein
VELAFTPPAVSGPLGDRFAFLHGSDKQRTVLTSQGPGNVSHSGVTDVMKLGGGLHQIKEFHVTRNYFRRQTRFALDAYDCLFNIVSDPDINPETLAVMSRILRPYRGRVINHPAAVALTGRDRMSRRLAGMAGINAPVTVRLAFANERAFRAAIGRSALAFPAIVRLTGTHNGQLTGPFANPEALLAGLERGRHYYLTSFVPYQNRDGLYRKVRFFFFGSRIVLRHLVISDHWNVHVRDRERIMFGRPDLLAEEKAAVAGGVDALAPAVQERLHAIRERVGIDFFGLDCSISDDGALTVFEANPAMRFFAAKEDPRVDYLEPAYARGREAFRALVAGAGG